MKIRLNKRSQITLPKPIMERLHLEEGDPLLIELDEKGRIVIEPMISIPRSQAWFWTESWQAAEKEAEEDYRAGRFQTIGTKEDLNDYFAKLDED
ncbi:MAG: AbrB/MazE/SpoVT family DNA-binding domain-containing protein [Bacilli bacterium]